MSLLAGGLISPEALPLLLVTAGLLISLAEAIAPGANFIVVGIGLLGAGLVGLLVSPLIALSPFALGILVLLFGMLGFYVYNELDIYGGKGTAQTSDSTSLQGMTGRVTETVTPTGGEVKLQGGGFNPFYSARSMDGEIPVGSDVMVIDPGGGNVITVESLETIEDDIDRELAADRAEKTRQNESAAEEFAEKHGVEPAEAEPAPEEKTVDRTDGEREPEFEQ